MSFLAPDFAPYLARARRAELEANAHTVVGLRPDDSIGYRNGAWTRFAAANGAPELAEWNGTPIVEIFHPDIQAFYRTLFRRVRETGEPADHHYQCSSPDTYREFVLRVLPLPDGHLLLIHHLSVEREHSWDPHDPGDAYVDADGFVTQCCHCRRTRRVDARDTWDWVPAYLDRSLEQVSHGLCPPCFRHYHPQAAARWDEKQSARDGQRR